MTFKITGNTNVEFLFRTWLSEEVIEIYKKFKFAHIHYIKGLVTFRHSFEDTIKQINESISSKLHENLILIDDSTEGYGSINPFLIEVINAIVQRCNLAARQIVIINQNIIFKDKNQSQCLWAFGDRFSIKSKKIAETISLENNNKIIPRKKFLCLNNKIRTHRILIYSFLLSNKLLNSTYFSFKINSLYHKNASNISKFKFESEKALKTFPIYSNLIKSLISKKKLEINLDDLSEAKYTRDIVWKIPTQQFEASSIVLVTESEFDFGKHQIRFTEKTLKPIICSKPFIIIGQPNTLQFLKEIGFKSFSPLINENYDKIFNPQNRMESICNEILRISKVLDNNIQNLDDINDICFFNKKHIVSGNLYRNVMNFHKKTLFNSLETGFRIS